MHSIAIHSERIAGVGAAVVPNSGRELREFIFPWNTHSGGILKIVETSIT